MTELTQTQLVELWRSLTKGQREVWSNLTDNEIIVALEPSAGYGTEADAIAALNLGRQLAHWAGECERAWSSLTDLQRETLRGWADFEEPREGSRRTAANFTWATKLGYITYSASATTRTWHLTEAGDVLAEYGLIKAGGLP